MDAADIDDIVTSVSKLPSSLLERLSVATAASLFAEKDQFEPEKGRIFSLEKRIDVTEPSEREGWRNNDIIRR
jgi:hypothetical protein